MIKTLTLDSKNAEKSEDFTIYFKIPLFNLKKIALKSMSMWVSWFNIDEKFNNHILKYTDHGIEHSIQFDNGNYTITELNDELQTHFGTDKSPIKLDIHYATSRFIIILKKGFKIDFRGHELYKILGFESKEYDQPSQKGKYIADISRGIDEIFIHCNIITSLFNEGNSDILYVYTHSNPPGSIIKINEINPISENVNRNDAIESIRMYITDQNGHIIDLNKQRVRYTLLLYFLS